MKKIKTLFRRDENDRRYVTREVEPGCEWVLAGEGKATRKYDGTCVMRSDDGSWWARREVKPGKAAPDGFVQEEHDETTGKTVGWEPAEQSAFAKYIAEAAERHRYWQVGTYELIGPKVNGNPEGWAQHTLIPHGETVYDNAPRDYDGIAAFLLPSAHEGIVWHHPDGRMAKIKRRDFRTSPSAEGSV